MARGGYGHRAFLLVVLLLIGGPVQIGLSAQYDGTIAQQSLIAEPTIFPASTGSTQTISLDGSTANDAFEVEVLSTEPLVDINMKISPAVQVTQSAIIWDDNSAWTHSDALMDGAKQSGAGLSLKGVDAVWDFNSGNDGWTFSNSYSGRSTLQCGTNGTGGGSIRTYAGSTYATSPVVNLNGLSSVSVHAWVKQGNSGCGEEPDTNENLAFQYKTSSGSWTTFQTYSGATPGGTAVQLNQNLPAAALHANSQIRAYQNSGSGTCCDYWFFDDVFLDIPSSATWISPTIGWASNASFPVSKSVMAPMYIDADVPAGARLDWTVLDDNGLAIAGINGSGTVIPLQLIDFENINEIRIKFDFNESNAGIPRIFALSFDGAYKDTLQPLQTGIVWTNNGALYTSSATQFSGNASANITSPWYSADFASESLLVEGQSTNAQAQIRFDRADNWTNISLPYTYNLDDTIYGLQLQFVALAPADGNMSNFTSWQVDEIELRFSGGSYPAQPAIDFSGDGLLEWGGSDARVGSWGWQDRFANGETQVEIIAGLSGYATTKAWIPKDDLQSLSFSVLAQSGTFNTVNIVVGSTTITTYAFTDARNARIELDILELDDLRSELAASNSAVAALGTFFVEVEIEVLGTGNITYGGLSAPYQASMTLDAGPQSAFILAINSARRGLVPNQGIHHIPVPFIASSAGDLKIELLSMNSSSEVVLVDTSMEDEPLTLTPSQQWMTMHTSYQVFSSTANMVRFDVFGSENEATWLLPLNGGTAIGQGDYDKVELHPTNALQSSINGTDVEFSITFRLEPDWDDEDILTVSSRLILSSNTVSIPATYYWGGLNYQGFENDLEIHSFSVSTAEGEIPQSVNFLQSSDEIVFTVDIGFEGVDSNASFADGDALVELVRGGQVIANTTSLDEDIWVVNDTIPFTHGNLTWTIRVTPLSGSGTTTNSEISRTFFIDSVIPRVLETNVGWYDHREPSTTQTMHIQITDQPELPTNVHAKVWRQWLEDDNMNGWPDPGEYSSMSLLKPSNLGSLIGQYTLLLDDSGGSIGQKVAVYIVGQDTAGYAIKDAGSNQTGEHLFMYQLAPDGPPSIMANAFSWQDGRQAWLHPDMPYVLEVDISEPNGGSDLASVAVALAGNQGSDPLLITWNFETGNCTSSSTHIILDDCKMMGANGLATPYEKDMTLQIELHLAWTMPDLGETRREPIVTVVDRAGQEATRSFPENRWKFSAAMEVLEESVNLHLSSGTLLGDGARLGPNSDMEISGGVVFSETGTIPDFNCTIDILFAGESKSALAQQGIWNIALTTPGLSGTIPLTWSVGCMPEQGIDATDKGTSVRWIVVDGEGPIPVEILSPRTGAILGSEQHEIRIVVSEEGGIDLESLQLVWWIEDEITGEYLRDGTEPMLLVGNEIEGLRLELTSSINLTGITDNMLEDRLKVYVRIAGRDLAGNQILGFSGAPTGTLVAQWSMILLEPEYQLEPSSVKYSRLMVEVGQTTSVQISVQNIGTLDGTTDAVITAVSQDGTRTTVRRTSVNVPKGGIGIINLDWGPENSGLQWIEVTLEDGETASGPSIDVRPEREVTTSEKIFGDVHPVLGTFIGILFLSIIITGLIWAKKLTNNKGSKEHYDWDEYSSELEDNEDDEYVDQEEVPSIQPAAIAAVQTQVEEEVVESKWELGADGYWWYHDKETNEWWYKDAEGNIVQFS
jgi:hypothetical protein